MPRKFGSSVRALSMAALMSGDAAEWAEAASIQQEIDAGLIEFVGYGAGIISYREVL